LRFSKPMDVLWQFIDGFYRQRDHVVRGDDKADPHFKDNPTFVVSYVYLGMRLFLYAVYHRLDQAALQEAIQQGLAGRPAIWFHPEEVLLYFWTEEALLHRIALAMLQLEQKPDDKEQQMDLRELTSLCVVLRERFVAGSPKSAIRYVASSDK